MVEQVHNSCFFNSVSFPFYFTEASSQNGSILDKPQPIVAIPAVARLGETKSLEQHTNDLANLVDQLDKSHKAENQRKQNMIDGLEKINVDNESKIKQQTQAIKDLIIYINDEYRKEIEILKAKFTVLEDDEIVSLEERVRKLVGQVEVLEAKVEERQNLNGKRTASGNESLDEEHGHSLEKSK